MRIGEAAERSGITAKAIRYYEQIGLIHPPARADSNYRAYSERDVHILKFIERARGLGFTLAECRVLLALYEDRTRASADVKAIALKHLDDIDAKIRELQSMRRTIERLANACHGNDRPDCPILDELAREV